jgi:hypothetical protein
MTYTIVLIFVIGSSLNAIQVGNKNYSKLEDCLIAARAATQAELFSNNYMNITATGYCAPQ